MRILIVGCGDIGTGLGKRMAADGHEVIGMRRKASHIKDPLKSIAADISAGCPTLPKKLDLVLFSASADKQTAAAYQQIYVRGMRNLIQGLEKQGQKPKRIIFTSSTAVYGQSNGEWVDESSETKPKQFNGQAMLEAEQVLLSSPFPSVVLRLGGIYGSGRNYQLRKLMRGSLSIPPDVHYTNRIHRDDCVGALVHLIQLDDPEPIYIGVDSEPSDKREVLCWLAERLGAPPPEVAVAGSKDSERAGSKRCRNDKLVSSGYEFRYPNYRLGYERALFEGVRQVD